MAPPCTTSLCWYDSIDWHTESECVSLSPLESPGHLEAGSRYCSLITDDGIDVCGELGTHCLWDILYKGQSKNNSIILHCFLFKRNQESQWMGEDLEHVKKRKHLVKPNPYIFILEPTATLLMMLETKYKKKSALLSNKSCACNKLYCKFFNLLI